MSRALTDSPQLRQGCVNRWNQMRMAGFPTIAHVVGVPQCSIVLAYTLHGKNFCQGLPALPDVRGWCVNRTVGFSCPINSYGAYLCSTHGSPIRVGDWNARLAGDGRLSLDHPPQTTVRTPLPAWAAKYPYADGFIHPWDSSGRLLSGLHLSGSQRATCSLTSERTTSNGALRCFVSANDRLYDPCFRNPHSQEVAACSTAPGSVSFVRVLTR